MAGPGLSDATLESVLQLSKRIIFIVEVHFKADLEPDLDSSASRLQKSDKIALEDISVTWTSLYESPSKKAPPKG